MNCGHNYELMKVEEEALNEPPSSTYFLCFNCGDVIHGEKKE